MINKVKKKKRPKISMKPSKQSRLKKKKFQAMHSKKCLALVSINLSFS